ncbi:TIR domain-containing protein [Nocardia asteroides]|uniref:TIR domain-containing protein n=1 Tax=Nocardia asteroides TaxID=1824 RepID=UPI0034328619
MSYSHRNSREVHTLLELLKPRLALSARVEVRWWADPDLPVGTDWFETIERRMAECEYGLHMISPEFFASEFIRTHEIPPFIGAGAKRTLPVGVYRVPLESDRDLAGFGRLQVFRPGDRWFGELTERRAKVRFADELADRILDVIDDQRVAGW